MTLPDLLIALSFFDTGVAIFACYCWREVRRRGSAYALLKERSARANDNYRKYQASMLESKDALQLQLEAAEKAWGDAQAQLEYKEKETTRFLTSYKKLEARYQDLAVNHDNLVRQFNSLTKGTDEMPT